MIVTYFWRLLFTLREFLFPGDIVIFDAKRDNNGKGIEVGELIRILESIED